jgi:hypothetical protein
MLVGADVVALPDLGRGLGDEAQRIEGRPVLREQGQELLLFALLGRLISFAAK